VGELALKDIILPGDDITVVDGLNGLLQTTGKMS
jgi:hypothetical protein